MKKLSLLDSMFLLMDNEEQKMHVLSYFMFEKPRSCPDDYMNKLVQEVRKHPWPFPHFRDKVSRSLGSLGLYYWDTDFNMDMKHHVQYAKAPGKGTAKDLRDYTTDYEAESLDYSRPLWELRIIDGLEDSNQFAIVMKVHHSGIDGVSAMNMLEELLRVDPSDYSNPDMASKKKQQNSKARKVSKVSKVSFVKSLQVYLKGLKQVIGGIRTGESMLLPPKGKVPITRFNEVVAPTRSFATVSLSLPEVNALSKATGGTVNDVVSAIIGTGMHRYLEGKGEVLDKSLYATMPVSLHTDGDMDESNKISMTCYPLASDVKNPSKQIRTIQKFTRKAKDEMKELPQSVMTSLMALGAIPILIKKIRGVRKIDPRLMTNVMISNVPSFKEPRYYKGSKLLGLYPLSLIMDGIGINITVSSYIDSLDFGLASDKTMAPDIELICDHMVDAMEEMKAEILGEQVNKIKAAIALHTIDYLASEGGKKSASAV